MRYQAQHPPYAHQAEALRLLEGQRAFGLFMAMRTGKTKVAIDDFGRLYDSSAALGMLVVAPAGVYETWAGEIRRHLDLRLLERARVFTWRAQRRVTREQDEFMAYRGGPRFLLVNVEALSAVERAQELCLEFVGQVPAMVVVDESTTIKNPRASRTKFLTNVVSPVADYRRILSGLPTPRSPLDIFAQFEFLEPGLLGYHNFQNFQRRYARTRPHRVGGRVIRIVVGFQNLPELSERVRPHSFRVRLEDCYDLPPKIYQTRDVLLDPRQRELYESLRDRASAQLGEQEHVTATEVITQILRMHQVLCGHVFDEEGKLHEVPERRTDALLELLEEHDGKAVVWCSYDYSVQKVSAALRKEYGEDSVARFWGGNKSGREAEEVRFKTDPRCRFMVATAAAGGRGREWSAADLVVYYSNTMDLEHRSQSEERTQAIGKSRSVLYVDLVARETVDEKIIRGLRDKIDLAATITGDDYQEWLV